MYALSVVTARCHVEVLTWTIHHAPDCSVPGEEGLNAYVKLNGALFADKLSCGSSHTNPSLTRGTNFQLLHPFSCSVIEHRAFDTNEAGPADRLRDYLDQLDDFSVIVGSMTEDATMNLRNAHNALLRVGVDLRDVLIMGTFAFVTQKSTNETVLRKVRLGADSHDNPANVSVMITGKIRENR